MAIYSYIKAPPGYTLKKPTNPLRYLRAFVSVFLLTLGVASFTTVAYPILSYQILYAPKLQKKLTPISPLVQPEVILSNNSVTTQAPRVLPEVLGTSLDFTDSELWYPTHSVQSTSSRLIYSLKIPKIKIDGATVRNDHTDLRESLIHYKDTAAPGDLGNVVIFGHSVLPQYFNQYDYHTIFSTLHTLRLGDEIILKDTHAEFRYIINEMYETTPDDLTPLAQRYDNRYLTLITCTPPGTYLRRLIIKATLL